MIEPSRRGYSDLAVCTDGFISRLFERGGLGDNHFRTAILALARFDLAGPTDGKDLMERERK